MKLESLKNPLENRVTILRVYRSMFNEFNLTDEEWDTVCSKVNLIYERKYGEIKLERVKQKVLFGKRKQKTSIVVYPIGMITPIKFVIKKVLKNKH